MVSLPIIPISSPKLFKELFKGSGVFFSKLLPFPLLHHPHFLSLIREFSEAIRQARRFWGQPSPLPILHE